MKVEKRDGTTQIFNFDKIERVVFRVYSSIGKPVPEKFLSDLRVLFDKILEKAEGKGDGYVMPIEDIQDIIRDQLIKKNQVEAAESFILSPPTTLIKISLSDNFSLVLCSKTAINKLSRFKSKPLAVRFG